MEVLLATAAAGLMPQMSDPGVPASTVGIDEQALARRTPAEWARLYQNLLTRHGAIRLQDAARHQALADSERRRKEAFVSTLVHELRQPLTVLRAAIDMVHLGGDPVASNSIAELLKRQIDQMNRLVTDLTDATRWASGKVTIRKQRVDVREIVRDAVLDVAATAAERGHKVVIDAVTEPLMVDADPQRLQQVLSNLLRNAMKFSEPGGQIRLTAGRVASTIVVRVSDTGEGIEAGALLHIFDLFTQVHVSDAEGLGIGLSVVREIVALHDGLIEARSQGLGQGSEFIVTLPIAFIALAAVRSPLNLGTDALAAICSASV